MHACNPRIQETIILRVAWKIQKEGSKKGREEKGKEGQMKRVRREGKKKKGRKEEGRGGRRERDREIDLQANLVATLNTLNSEDPVSEKALAMKT